LLFSFRTGRVRIGYEASGLEDKKHNWLEVK
jgi:hypothetical protein